MFANLSNHPSAEWPAEQYQAALLLGAHQVVDVPFPGVDPELDGEPFRLLARATAQRVAASGATVAMVQGESTMVYAIVGLLRSAGIRCYAATTERDSVAQTGPGGAVLKTSVFRFVRFREYQCPGDSQ